ncbi:helix-turn-helix domain-containing protein [Fulvimarina sp. MAC3]|uniref:winged helix-turn-helix transcriptional regulator n=1 Tax=Fulvimarina sp. MAC3 TaxID=3148887 RepID=UPI0031FC9D62
METTRKTVPDATEELNEASPAVCCASDRVLRMLWGQWKTHVIYVLGTHGPQRFGALRRIIAGISPKVLTQRLRELEVDGLVWRKQAPTIPPEVTYGLTERGHRIHGVLTKFDAIDVE